MIFNQNTGDSREFWLTGIIETGKTSVTITDSKITDDTVLQAFTDNIEATGKIAAYSIGSVTVTIDEALSAALTVKVRGVNV